MKLKNFFKRISYSIIPFLIFIIVLLVSYFGNQLLYKYGITSGSTYPETEIDKFIPLVPWLVYFYFLTFPLGIITFFYLAYKNKKAFYDLFITLVICFAISGIIYFFAQTYFVKPEFEANSFTDKLVVWTWGSTNPVNCLPSQHCFMAIAIIIACVSSSSKRMGGGFNKLFSAISIIISFFIIASTVLIKQHYFLDIITSFDIMLIVYPIVSLLGVGKRMAKNQESRAKKRAEKKLLKKLEKDSKLS